MKKCEPASHDKHDHVRSQSIDQFAGRDQTQRQLNIVSVKDPVELSIAIADVHINDRMHAKKSSIENIFQQPTEKSYDHAFFPTAHKPEGSCQNDHKIGADRTNSKSLKHRTLQKEAEKNHQSDHNFTLHLFFCPPIL